MSFGYIIIPLHIKMMNKIHGIVVSSLTDLKQHLLIYHEALI